MLVLFIIPKIVNSHLACVVVAISMLEMVIHHAGFTVVRHRIFWATSGLSAIHKAGIVFEPKRAQLLPRSFTMANVACKPERGHVVPHHQQGGLNTSKHVRMPMLAAVFARRRMNK